MKSKIVIFESNKLDGKMSKNPKFYPKNTTEKERYEIFHQDRINLGKKLGVDGNHILRSSQKGLSKFDYKDGKYIARIKPNGKSEEEIKEAARACAKRLANA